VLRNSVLSNLHPFAKLPAVVLQKPAR